MLEGTPESLLQTPAGSRASCENSMGSLQLYQVGSLTHQRMESSLSSQLVLHCPHGQTLAENLSSFSAP